MPDDDREPVMRAGDWFHLKNRGWVATFAADAHGVVTPPDVLGKPVVIDDTRYTVKGVEWCLVPHHYEDLRHCAIGLLVEPAP